MAKPNTKLSITIPQVNKLKNNVEKLTKVATGIHWIHNQNPYKDTYYIEAVKEMKRAMNLMVQASDALHEAEVNFKRSLQFYPEKNR